jgi:hypothetical protein
MTIAKQRLAKQVPERDAVNKNKRPLLDNGFGEHAFPWQRFATHVGYHGNKHVSDTTDTWTTVLEPLEAVIYIRLARGYKRRPDQTRDQRVGEPVSQWMNQSQRNLSAARIN